MPELKAALATYTESGSTGRTALDQDEAVAVMLEKHEVCCGLFYGFDWSKWTTGTPQERLGLLPAAQERILTQENGKDRLIRAVRELSQAFALAVPHEKALAIRDDVAFFQAVQAVLAKRAPGEARSEEELDHAVRQIISRAVAPEGVVDIFGFVKVRYQGLEKNANRLFSACALVNLYMARRHLLRNYRRQGAPNEPSMTNEGQRRLRKSPGFALVRLR